MIASWLLARSSLPLVLPWAGWQERRILREGRPLMASEFEDARRLGLRSPERVRVLVVDEIPPQLPRRLRELAEYCGLGPAQTIGMALGYGIFLRGDALPDRTLLLHELAHTAQYERLGFRGFLTRYLEEIYTGGYPSGPLEQEARRIAEEHSVGR